MDHNGAKQPLLSGLTDSSPRTNNCNGHAPCRRRLRRVRSAPLADCLPKDPNCNTPFPRSPSIFGNLHPSFCTVAIFLAVYLGVGTICFSVAGNQISGKKTNGILDAVYFCVVTMTTVGYGDLVPNSVFTKLVACASVFSGMALVGLILSSAADYLVEKQELLLIKAFYMSKRVGNSEIIKEAESHRVRYKLITVSFILVVMILSGTIFLATVEKLDLVDAFYCVCSTITTLGYGDHSFSTMAGRVFAIFWILTSTVCLAQFFLYVAELNTENRQRALVNWVLARKVTNIDLEAADLDEDGAVNAAEFILYKLKEMGKISQEDISLVMEEFEDLDVDQSGTLSASDINLAQSTETKG